jgi:thiamine biosynthesis lipoprotein
MSTLTRFGFRAMGTEIELISPYELPDTTLTSFRDWFERVEATLSRFRPESELSMLNATAGRPFQASAMLSSVLREALHWAQRTDGLYDPTVLESLRSAGYRESSERISWPRRSEEPDKLPCWRAVDITNDGVVTLPIGVGIDLGGYAKGWTVDMATRLLPASHAWLLDAGGDLFANGVGPDGRGWLVGIEDPHALGADLMVLRVQNGAVATSTTMRRRWLTGDGRIAHHLIDPRTGKPGDSDLASVTVVAETVAEAEVLAKVLLQPGAGHCNSAAYCGRACRHWW